jgi:aminobenzoyl-glutamate utilization protein B
MRKTIGAFLLLSPLLAHAQDRERADVLLQRIDAKRSTYIDVAKQIWTFAEVGYRETQSSALLQEQLRASGFAVRAGVADIPTAFVATFGSGKPIIAIIGENAARRMTADQPRWNKL